jgi:hypothetical protein
MTKKKVSKKQSRTTKKAAKKKVTKKVTKKKTPAKSTKKKVAKKQTKSTPRKKVTKVKTAQLDPVIEALNALTLEVAEFVDTMKNLAFNKTPIVREEALKNRNDKLEESSTNLESELDSAFNSLESDTNSQLNMFDEFPASAPAQPEKTYTKQEIMTLLQDAATAHGLPAVQNLLSQYDAQRVSDLPEDKYGEVANALEKL